MQRSKGMPRRGVRATADERMNSFAVQVGWRWRFANTVSDGKWMLPEKQRARRQRNAARQRVTG